MSILFTMKKARGGGGGRQEEKSINIKGGKSVSIKVWNREADKYGK